MIRTLVWKEYREHRAIWLTLAVVGGAGLFGLSQLMAPEGFLGSSGARESLQTVAVLFAWTYGLVCGAMLLANEQEAGTMTFLDILPARRLQLWLVKCSFGLLLLLAQVAVLTAFVVGLGIVVTTGQLLATLVAMLVFGLMALSWSLLFSAVGDNVLNVIGFAFIGQIAGSFVALILLFCAAFVLTMIRDGQADDGEAFKLSLVCLGVVGLTVGPILGSARLFTRLDRQRARPAGWSLGRPVDINAWDSWRRLLWLSYVQMRRLLVGLIIFSLVLGFLLPLSGPAAWPVLTLLLGVLCGVTVWSDEQMSASFRFLGDQRFPLGRVWIVKVGMRFALAALAAFLLLLPSLVLAMMHQVEEQSQTDRALFSPTKQTSFSADLFHSSLVGPIVPGWTHLSIWLLYGFTAGHLCGLLFRKSLVATVVALGSACMLLCFWVPSLMGVGLHLWQVAGVPLILLVAGWLLMPAWTTDRLVARGTFVRLGAVLLAAGLWTAGGLWYRVAEIPDLPDAYDMAAFAAGIPSMDQTKNRAGMEMHAAWHEVEQLTHGLFFKNVRPRKPLFPGEREAPLPSNDVEVNAFNAFHGEVLRVLSPYGGWPNHPSDLGDMLDAEFKKDWYGHLSKVADLPLGVVEDAKLMTVNAPTRRWQLLTDLNRILAVRGLQMQARGDHRIFADNLRISLALSRNVQNHAPPHLVHAGRYAELVFLNALDLWLKKLPSHPELLERVRDALLQHQAQLPDETDVLKTAYLIARNTLEQSPQILVEEEMRATRDRGHKVAELQKAEMELVSWLWRIPWEHERHQRILRVVFEGSPEQRRQATGWGGAVLSCLDREARNVMPRDKKAAASLYAAQLKVAIRLFQAKFGKLPDKLTDLVDAKCLPSIPLDPFDKNNQPFHYRVEQGRDGLSAEAVLWSVGVNGRDDGGIGQDSRDTSTLPGMDLIYPVPPPPY